MIKVIVADDESRVSQLICNLVDWPSLGMEVVGVAGNGIEALELVELFQPDLIITDIRMPGCDGLELVRRAKEIKADLEFIIVSGYRHFEYAQSAIKYGVCDYLSKPIKKDELTETLQKMRKKHLQHKERLSKEEQMKIRLQSDHEKLRASLFQNLLQRSDFLDRLSLEQLNREYHYHFSPGVLQAFVVKIDFEYDGAYHPEIDIFRQKIRKILRGYLSALCHDLEIYFQHGAAYGILNYQEADKSAVRKQMKACLDELLVQKGILGDMEVTVGLGEAVATPDQLALSLKTAERNVAQRLLEGTGALFEEVQESGPLAERDKWLSELGRQLESALEVLDTQSAASAIDRLKERLEASPACGSDIFQAVVEAYRLFLTMLRNFQPSTEIDMDEEYRRFSVCAGCLGSVDRLFAHLFRQVERFITLISQERKQADAKPIRAAKQYILSNYQKPLTLEEVGGVVGFNASYFSSLFKKESGVNFLEYLSEVRMNKAKELLRETDLSVAVVCQEVGYSDIKHFTKNFKKFSGLSPNEFRKLYA